MEDRCVPLRNLDEKTVEWYTKVILLTKGILVNSKGKAGSFQRFLFADKKKTVMQAVIYTKDLNFLEQKLQLYETYYIGNAFITKIEDPKYQYGSVPFQMTLTRKSFLEKVERTKSYHLDECLPITPFWEIDVDPDKENENLSVKLGTFHGTCVGAQNNTKIIFDPPIPETNSLKTWIVENKDYAENVIKEKLYEKQKQEVRVPKEKHIRQINQVLNIQHTVKNCWVKATATIKDNQRLYTAICPNCDNPSGAPMGIISTCNYCGTSGKAPKPGLKFVINLADITGTLQAVIQNEYAEKLLRYSADEVYHNHLAVSTNI
ncbi:OLC1v1019439C1 [Oldenlandia corymbosa var. corymbosa]|uniref:OLC1v1019439C1 n=1 Tax=Oldenlandia corymbosa var. corymbosa TaxID=529605 RepID=A0AAV1EEH1_OLDCO|nr:OLC1v1019439C1 [Oldenlandia corymbosa var. corymbosa]